MFQNNKKKIIRDSSGDKQNFSLNNFSTIILMLLKIECVNAHITVIMATRTYDTFSP